LAPDGCRAGVKVFGRVGIDWLAVTAITVAIGPIPASEAQFTGRFAIVAAAAAWNSFGGRDDGRSGDGAAQTTLPAEVNDDDPDVVRVEKLNLQHEIDVSVWKVHEDRNTVHVSSTDYEMLVLGEYQSGRLSFDVELQQRGLAGKVGLFLGLRQLKEPDPRGNLRKGYLVWRLERLLGDDGRNQMRPLFEYFSVGSPYIRNSEGLAGLELPPLSKGETRLGFTIEDNRLLELWISDGGERYSMKEPSGLSPLFEDCRGPFGLYCYDTNAALFSKPRINDREKRLLAK